MSKCCRYAKYVRERGEVEREYARALRKLVTRCRPRFDYNDNDDFGDIDADPGDQVQTSI